MEYVIKEYSVYHESEILKLYKSVGWTAYTDNPEVLKNGFGKSLLTLAAYDKEQLLGIIRTVGDGYTIVFIQDLLILPEYQHMGIGTGLIQAVLKRFSHVRQIQLMTDNTAKTIAFYKTQGLYQMSELGCCGFMKA